MAGARASNRAKDSAVEQHGVGIEQQIVQEHAAERDAEQVDVPARFGRRVEIEVFQQQHVADGEAQPDGDAERRQRVPPGRRTARSSSGVPHSTSSASSPIVLKAGASWSPGAGRAAVEVQDEPVPGGGAADLQPGGDRAERDAGRMPRWRRPRPRYPGSRAAASAAVRLSGGRARTAARAARRPRRIRHSSTARPGHAVSCRRRGQPDSARCRSAARRRAGAVQGLACRGCRISVRRRGTARRGWSTAG